MKDACCAASSSGADDPELLAGAGARARAARPLQRDAATTSRPSATALLRELLGSGRRGRRRQAPAFRCDYGDEDHDRRRDVRQLRLRDARHRADRAAATTCWLATQVQLLAATHPIDPGPRGATAGSTARRSPSATRLARRRRHRLPGRDASASDTVVGAGAVVTRDLPAGVVAYGNPARVVRDDRRPRPRAACRRERPRRAPTCGLLPRSCAPRRGRRSARRARASRAWASTPRCGSRSAPPARWSTARGARAGRAARWSSARPTPLNTAIKARRPPPPPGARGPAAARSRTPTELSFPSAHASTSFAAARAYARCCPPRRSTPRRRRWRARASTSACTTPPTSPPARCSGWRSGSAAR